MIRRPPLLAVILVSLIGWTVCAYAQRSMPGVSDARQAHIDYMLKCQGCHRPDGSGDSHSNPPLRDNVARFLDVPGGREFLGRAPGVATVDLDDFRLVNLVNWTLYTFDPQHIPVAFHPYTAQELGVLRQNPLRLERVETRARLVAEFPQTKIDKKLIENGSKKQ